MVDNTQAPPADSGPDDPVPKKKGRGWRRSLLIIIAILFAFVVYAFAFAKTDVSLDEIQSETRQEQLFRILRALARPDLIRYDKEDLIVTADVQIPCTGTDPSPATPHESGATIVVTPSCSSPGETMTVDGTGFEPGKRVTVNFVPVSDFDIVLPQGRADVLEDGTFSLTFETPLRESEEPQQVEAITQTNVGGWRNRVSVWTDTNGNGVQDPSNFSDSDEDLTTYALALPEFEIRNPGGVTLVDDNNNVLDFVSWGGSFEALTGSGTGLVSRDIGIDPFSAGESQSVQLVGTGEEASEFEWAGPAAESFGATNANQEFVASRSASDSFFNEVALDDETGNIEVAGPPGASLKGVSLIFFDATDGNQYKIIPIVDKTDLSPRLSDNALSTWDRIVETVMLALLATTVGTFLAVPLSFLAAKNLMRDVTVPVINLSLSIIAIPIGLVLGVRAALWARRMSEFTDANIITLLVGLSILAAIGFLILRWTFPPEDADKPPLGTRLLRVGALIVVAFIALIMAYLTSDLLVAVGEGFEDLVPALGFLGNFVVKLGEISLLGIPVFAAIIGAFAFAAAASKLGYVLFHRWNKGMLNAATLITSAVAGAVVGVTIGGAIDWFYQLENPTVTVLIPAIVGALFGMLLSVKALRKGESQNIGLTVYYLSRTLFNGLRSIEPLVMVIIFVVWVGIGPFAGALALALHTTAALAKLYSEQVESIATGPLEAVKATGATRLQTVIYAVVPQIIPPYISFTMYRWDINVRMSTIIGFAGGGGIGFLLQQNINLLQYRAAAAQMLAIAIVVASMDYLSSRIRERIV